MLTNKNTWWGIGYRAFLENVNFPPTGLTQDEESSWWNGWEYAEEEFYYSEEEESFYD